MELLLGLSFRLSKEYVGQAVRYFNRIFVLLVLLSSACGGSAPALPTIDVAKAAQQTLAAAAPPTQPPTQAPTVTPPAAVLTQPTPILQLTGIIPSQPTAVLDNLRVSFVDVGAGDATLLLAPDGKVALIDGGETDAGIVPYLQSAGIDHIDLMIATDSRPDHIGGLVQVLQAMPVGTVVANAPVNTPPIYESFLGAIASTQAQLLEVKQGDTLALGSLTFNVLNPVSEAGEALKDSPIVLRLVFGEVAFLFMGDAEKEAGTSILAAGLPVQAQILKVGFHGSQAASSPAFLSQVKPEVAIYFTGLGNPNEQPDPAALRSLGAVGANIFDTDVHGTITITTVGSGYTVDVARPGQAPIVFLPTPPPAPKPLTLEFIAVTNPVARGGKATVVARTAPGARCDIKVYYRYGSSESPRLEAKIADGEGRVAWTWKVGIFAALGEGRIVITADLNGEIVTQEISFEVEKQ